MFLNSLNSFVHPDDVFGSDIWIRPACSLMFFVWWSWVNKQKSRQWNVPVICVHLCRMFPDLTHPLSSLILRGTSLHCPLVITVNKLCNSCSTSSRGSMLLYRVEFLCTRTTYAHRKWLDSFEIREQFYKDGLITK